VRKRQAEKPITPVQDRHPIKSGHGFEKEEDIDMKRQALKIFAMLTLLVTVGATSVYGQVTARYSIPFNFVVAGKLLPAGEYLVERGSYNDLSILLMQNLNWRISLFTGTIPIGGRVIQDRSKLVFHQYGDHYFLAQVWTTHEKTGRKLIPTRAERQMALKRAPVSSAMKTETAVIFPLTSQGGGSGTTTGQ
jgi:hypothetical protein